MAQDKGVMQPPAYDGPPGQQRPPPPVIEDLSVRLNNLTFSPNPGKLDPVNCIAHLKFLEALYQLRESVANEDGLFGIATPPEDKSEKSEKKNADAQIRVREKRWAVYVARAVDRFETWWKTCIPQTVAGAPVPQLTKTTYLHYLQPDIVALMGKPIRQLNRDQLPPLGKLAGLFKRHCD